MELVSLTVGAALGALAVFCIEHFVKGFNLKDIRHILQDNKVQLYAPLKMFKDIDEVLLADEDPTFHVPLLHYILSSFGGFVNKDLMALDAITNADSSDEKFMKTAMRFVTRCDDVKIMEDEHIFMLKSLRRDATPHLLHMLKEIENAVNTWTKTRCRIAEEISEKTYGNNRS